MGRVRATYRGLIGRLAVLALLVAPLAAQPDEPVVFASDVRLVTLPVTVKDSRGAPIGDLGREEFEILEEGARRELAIFERSTDRPLSVVLMVDTSLSTAIELRYERESAKRFLASLLGSGSQPADRAAIFSFSADVEIIQGFTRDQNDLEQALGRIRPQTGTSVYDAVRAASSVLGRRDGRRVIIVITDGGDTTSRSSFGDALRAAHDAEVAIYPLIVLPIVSDAGRNRGGEHALITLADRTGGETFVQHGAVNLDESFEKVLVSLRTQYFLGFYPRLEGVQRKEVFRRIEIRANRPGAAVLARSGYYADPDIRAVESPRLRRAPTSLRTLPQARGAEDRADEPESEPPEVKRGKPDGKPRPKIVRP